MTQLAVLKLRKDEDRRIRAGHSWIFSNEIDVAATPIASLEPGQIVELHDWRGSYLGSGYANPASLITVRLLTRDPNRRVDAELLHGRIERALRLRDALYPGSPYYRLVYGESDGLPGLVVDRFGDILVVQPGTAGVERLLAPLIDALVQLTAAKGVLIKADAGVRRQEGLESYTRTAFGFVPPSVELYENGVSFEAHVLEGQKTGWFYDHRENRATLQRHVAGRRVLDVFSYVGGWGVQAAVAGAADVRCIDSSGPALEGVAENSARNGVKDRVSTDRADAFEALQKVRLQRERFDIVVLDPPAFIKRKKDAREGEQAYRRLNRLALEVLPVEGLLVSASCSFHLSRDALLRTIVWAAARAGRDVQIVHEGHQGPDHPVHPAIPETSYLKAFFVRVLA